MAAAALLATGGATAGGLPTAGGSSLGDGSQYHSIYTIGNNPAGLTASPRVGFQMGILSAGLGYELGKLDNFVDDFENSMTEIDDFVFLGEAITTLEDGDTSNQEKLELLEKLDTRFEDLTVDQNTDDQDIKDFAEERLNDTVDSLNTTFTTLEEDGRLDINIHARPLMPLIVGRANSGWAFGFDAAVDVHGSLQILSNGIDEGVDANTISTNDDWFDIAANLQGGRSIRTSFNSALRVQEHNNRTIHVGARVNHYDVELYRTVSELAGGEEANELLSDDMGDNARQSTGLGVDLGLIYQSSHLTGGVSWLNINEPKFDYPDIQTDAYADRVPVSDTWTMAKQLRYEGALHDSQQRYTLAVSYDNDSVTDMTGAEYQWLTYGAAVRLPWYLKWIPDLRAGYRENQTGTELSYYSIGFNWLGVISLDVAFSDETIESDGDDIPRSAYANVGVQLRF